MLVLGPLPLLALPLVSLPRLLLLVPLVRVLVLVLRPLPLLALPLVSLPRLLLLVPLVRVLVLVLRPLPLLALPLVSLPRLLLLVPLVRVLVLVLRPLPLLALPLVSLPRLLLLVPLVRVLVLVLRWIGFITGFTGSVSSVRESSESSVVIIAVTVALALCVRVQPYSQRRYCRDHLLLEQRRHRLVRLQPRPSVVRPVRTRHFPSDGAPQLAKRQRLLAEFAEEFVAEELVGEFADLRQVGRRPPPPPPSAAGSSVSASAGAATGGGRLRRGVCSSDSDVDASNAR